MFCEIAMPDGSQSIRRPAVRAPTDAEPEAINDTNSEDVVCRGATMSWLRPTQNTYAITGCGNNYLVGTYNAQISSVNFQNLLTRAQYRSYRQHRNDRRDRNNWNHGSATGSPDHGSTVHGKPTVRPVSRNNPASLGGKVPGLGRYLLRRKRQHYRTGVRLPRPT